MIPQHPVRKVVLNTIQDNFESYCERIQDSLNRTDIFSVELAIHKILASKDKKLFIAGNGGSSALASHFCTDLNRSFVDTKSHPYPISLVDNSPMITAISNDFEFSQIFSKQIAQLGQQGDLLLCISSSGNSKNLINALNLSREIGISTIGLTSFTGGIISELVEISIHVPTKVGDYGVAEDCHSAILHFMASQLKDKSI